MSCVVHRRYNAFNLAVGGERTETLLFRLQKSDWTAMPLAHDGAMSGGVEGVKDKRKHPLIAVVMIGTNNVGNGNTATEVLHCTILYCTALYCTALHCSR